MSCLVKRLQTLAICTSHPLTSRSAARFAATLVNKAHDGKSVIFSHWTENTANAFPSVNFISYIPCCRYDVQNYSGPLPCAKYCYWFHRHVLTLLPRHRTLVSNILNPHISEIFNAFSELFYSVWAIYQMWFKQEKRKHENLSSEYNVTSSQNRTKFVCFCWYVSALSSGHHQVVYS